MRSTSFCMCTSHFSSLQKLLNTWVAFISFSLCTALQSTQQGCRSCFYELFPLESAQRSVKSHPHFIFKFWCTFVHFFTNVTVNSSHPSTVCKDHFTPLPHPFFIGLYSFFFTKATLIGMRRYIIIGLINISMIIMHSFHGLEGQWDVFLWSVSV